MRWSLARHNRLGLLHTSMLVVAGCRRSEFSREILYGAQQPGAPESIWALNPSTGSSRLVLPGDSLSSRQEPRWAPDGRAIAFVREFESKVELYIQDFLHRFDSLELYMVKPDGMALRRLPTNRTFDSHPSW